MSSGLWEAAFNGYTEDIEPAVKNGANLEYVGAYGSTPLSIACQKGHLDCVKVLIKLGSNYKHERYTTGATPLFLAAQNGHLEIVQELMKLKLDVNVVQKTKMTPLHGAAQNGHAKVIKYLLSVGADVTMKNDNGEDAIQIAKKYLEEDKKGKGKKVKLFQEAISVLEGGASSSSSSKDTEKSEPKGDHRPAPSRGPLPTPSRGPLPTPKATRPMLNPTMSALPSSTNHTSSSSSVSPAIRSNYSFDPVPPRSSSLPHAASELSKGQYAKHEKKSTLKSFTSRLRRKSIARDDEPQNGKHEMISNNNSNNKSELVDGTASEILEKEMGRGESTKKLTSIVATLGVPAKWVARRVKMLEEIRMRRK